MKFRPKNMAKKKKLLDSSLTNHSYSTWATATATESNDFHVNTQFTFKVNIVTRFVHFDDIMPNAINEHIMCYWILNSHLFLSWIRRWFLRDVTTNWTEQPFVTLFQIIELVAHFKSQKRHNSNIKWNICTSIALTGGRQFWFMWLPYSFCVQCCNFNLSAHTHAHSFTCLFIFSELVGDFLRFFFAALHLLYFFNPNSGYQSKRQQF